MPDEELLAHAAAGDLHRPEVLAAQAARMLQDAACGRWPPSSAATGSTSAASRNTTPSIASGSRPSPTSCARRCSKSRSAFSSMCLQTTARCSIFSTRITRSSIPCWRSTTACPFRAAARTSGCGSTGADQYGRGGLLPMAVFLTKNAPGLRTSPVKRGYWVVQTCWASAFRRRRPTCRSCPGTKRSST